MKKHFLVLVVGSLLAYAVVLAQSANPYCSTSISPNPKNDVVPNSQFYQDMSVSDTDTNVQGQPISNTQYIQTAHGPQNSGTHVSWTLIETGPKTKYRWWRQAKTPTESTCYSDEFKWQDTTGLANYRDASSWVSIWGDVCIAIPEGGGGAGGTK